MINDDTVAQLFDEWWRDSYGNPPGGHAVMTHTAFAKYLLELVSLMQPIES